MAQGVQGNLGELQSFRDMLDLPDTNSSDESSDEDDEDRHCALVHASNTRMRTIRDRLAKICRWEALLSLLCLDGRSGFTEKQFTILRWALMERDKTLNIPESRTVKKSIRRTLLQHCFPRSAVTFVRENTASNTFARSVKQVHAVGAGDANGSGDTSPLNCVRLVLPSEWAKLDVACLHLYRCVYGDQHDAHDGTSKPPADVNIEDAMIVIDRELCFLRKGVLRAKFNGTNATWMTTTSDLLSFPCSRLGGIRDHHISGWREWERSSASGKARRFFVDGSCGPTFGVGFSDETEIVCDDESDPAFPSLYLNMERVVFEECRKPNRSLSFDASSLSSAQATLPSRPSIIDMDLYPGDVLTFVRPTEVDITEGICCVFHASPVSASRRRPAERLVWVSLEKGADDSVEKITTVCSTNVIGLPSFIDNERKLKTLRDRRHVTSNSGVLPNGDNFVVYRMALYGDGFSQNKASSYSKSVAGVYLLPLGLPVAERTSAHAVRPLCLTPHGIGAEGVMDKIIDDVCKYARHGIAGMDPFGRKVTIFLDVADFIGDYPQVAKYTDVLGHSADAMCSVCTIRKRKNRPTPANNYSNEIHSARAGYVRFDARAEAIRSAAPHASVLRILGMHGPSVDVVEELPAVSLSTKMKAMYNELRSADAAAQLQAAHPIPLIFDHVLAVPAVPDHLLSVLISSVMTACFQSLDNDHMRAVVEMRIVNAANSNGLEVRHNIATWEKGSSGRRFKGIASNTMSAWLSILLVSMPIFNELHSSQNLPVLLLPGKLQRFATLLYKWPKKIAEGRHSEAWDFSDLTCQVRYNHNVTTAAMAFLTAAREVYKDDRNAGGPLDRPMAHRLMELVMSTIPTYGHALLCSELILEHTHQTFKRWLVQNTHADAHISGMEKTLVRDWMWRLSSLYNLWKTGDNCTKSQAEIGLRRLLMGEEGMRIPESSRNGQALSIQLRAAIEDAMRAPVPYLLSDCDETNTSMSGTAGYEWSAVWDDQARQFDPMCYGLAEKIVSTRLPRDIQLEDLTFFKRARFMPRSSTGRQRSYPYNVVEYGTGISAIVATDYSSSTSESFVPTVTDGNGDCRYFVIAGIVGNMRTDHVWVAGKELTNTGSLYSCEGSTMKYLMLDKACRRVALVHSCSSACVRDCGRSEPKHEKTCLDGGKYYIIDRANGFPPFQG